MGNYSSQRAKLYNLIADWPVNILCTSIYLSMDILVYNKNAPR